MRLQQLYAFAILFGIYSVGRFIASVLTSPGHKALVETTFISPTPGLRPSTIQLDQPPEQPVGTLNLNQRASDYGQSESTITPAGLNLTLTPTELLPIPSLVPIAEPSFVPFSGPIIDRAPSEPLVTGSLDSPKSTASWPVPRTQAKRSGPRHTYTPPVVPESTGAQLRPRTSEPIPFVRCFGQAAAYSGSWLALRSTFLRTPFPNHTAMEYHDFNFFTAGGGTGRRLAIKTLRMDDFFVEHLSGYEHNFEKMISNSPEDQALLARKVKEIAEDIARSKCGHLEKGRQRHLRSIVLIPFFGGPPEAVGNAHSTSSRETKLLQTKGVICAAADYFGPVKVGVCNDDDGEAIRSLEFEFVEVVRLQCAIGVHLPFVFLRTAQQRLSAGLWTADSIFFTEADQVVYARDAEALSSALGDAIYVAPNRVNQEVRICVELAPLPSPSPLPTQTRNQVCGGAGTPSSHVVAARRSGVRGGAGQGNCSTALNEKAIASNLALRVHDRYMVNSPFNTCNGGEIIFAQHSTSACQSSDAANHLTFVGSQSAPLQGKPRPWPIQQSFGGTEIEAVESVWSNATLRGMWRPDKVFIEAEYNSHQAISEKDHTPGLFIRCQSFEATKSGAFLAHRFAVSRAVYADDRSRTRLGIDVGQWFSGLSERSLFDGPKPKRLPLRPIITGNDDSLQPGLFFTVVNMCPPDALECALSVASSALNRCSSEHQGKSEAANATVAVMPMYMDPEKSMPLISSTPKLKMTREGWLLLVEANVRCLISRFGKVLVFVGNDVDRMIVLNWGVDAVLIRSRDDPDLLLGMWKHVQDGILDSAKHRTIPESMSDRTRGKVKKVVDGTQRVKDVEVRGPDPWPFEFVYFTQPHLALLSTDLALDQALALVGPHIYVSPQPLVRTLRETWALLDVAGLRRSRCSEEGRELFQRVRGVLLVTPLCRDSDATLTEAHRMRHVGLGGGHHR